MYESKRTFKVWDYNVSHKQLLLRSPRTDGDIENIDIIFWGVEVVSIPTTFSGLSLHKLPSNELGDCLKSGTQCSEVPAFKLESIGFHGLVRAAGCKILTNQLDIFDSSLVYADQDRPSEDFGVVLVRL